MTYPIPPNPDRRDPESQPIRDLVDIYMTRPAQISWMNFGHWMNEAGSFNDRQLNACVTISEAKKIIMQRGYYKISMRVLDDYNKQFR